MRHNLIDKFLSLGKSLRKHWVWLLFSGLLMTIGWIWIDFSEVPVRQIVIQGHDKLTPGELVEWMGFESSSVEESSSDGALRSKLLTHPRIKMAQVERKSGGQLVVKIQERKAEFIIHTEQNLYEIDLDLNIISENDIREPNLPIISGKFKKDNTLPIFQGTKIIDLSKQIHSGLDSFPALKDRISEITLAPDGDLDIFLHSPARIRVRAGANLSLNLFRKLYASLAYFESEGQKVSLIDLRGEDAVYH